MFLLAILLYWFMRMTCACPVFNSINARLVESLIERKFCYYSWNYQQHLLLSTHWSFIELNWTGGCFASINASKRAINFQQSPYSISVQTAFSPTQFRLFRNFSWNAKVSIEVSFIKLASKYSDETLTSIEYLFHFNYDRLYSIGLYCWRCFSGCLLQILLHHLQTNWIANDFWA